MTWLIPSMVVARPPKLVIVSWDGAADWVMDRLVSEGKLPNVSRIKAQGVAAEFSSPPFPSKTAVSHFSIFSGTTPAESGVTGNSVPILPRSAHTLLESRSGFDANSHATEPIWVTLAKAGHKVLALSAAGSYPPASDQARLKASNTPLDRYVEFSGFEGGLGPSTVVSIDPNKDNTVKLKVGTQEINGEVRSGSLVLTTTDALGHPQTFTLTPSAPSDRNARWAGPLSISNKGLRGNTFLRLFQVGPEGRQWLLYARAAAEIRGTESTKVNEQYQKAMGGFHDAPFFEHYTTGELGAPLYEGGNGTAEEILMETVHFDMECLKKSFRYGLKTWTPDIVFHYSPQTDNAGHTWMGILDPESPAYNRELAEKLWPYYERVYQEQDAWLGDMLEAAGPGTTFALVSDHGMAGITKYFSVNRVLQEAGLLFIKDGKIDLSRTKVLAPPSGDFFLNVNTTEWKDGIVPGIEKERVLNAATKALLEAKDPSTGEHIVTRIFRPDGFVGLGIGGPAGGDLYLDLASGYYPNNRVGTEIVTTEKLPRGAGVHGFWPQRRSMQAIFYAAGPGIARGVTLPGIRTIDIMPTLCAALKLPQPKDASGIVVGQAIQK